MFAKDVLFASVLNAELILLTQTYSYKDFYLQMILSVENTLKRSISSSNTTIRHSLHVQWRHMTITRTKRVLSCIPSCLDASFVYLMLELALQRLNATLFHVTWLMLTSADCMLPGGRKHLPWLVIHLIKIPRSKLLSLKSQSGKVVHLISRKRIKSHAVQWKFKHKRCIDSMINM